MTSIGEEHIELRELLVQLVDNSLSEEQFSLLQQKLDSDPQAREYYYDFMIIHVGLRNRSVASVPFISTENPVFVPELDRSLWQELAEEEKRAAAVNITDVFPEKTGRELLPKLQIIPPKREVSRLTVYTALCSTAALLLLLVYVWSMPEKAPVVARLTDAINVQWAQKDSDVEIGGDLRAEQRKLLKGFAKITFDDGAEVIVEAPADITLKSSSLLFLSRGKLIANVPNHAIGFTVNTPASTVVDMGTEFGLQVTDNGTSEVHMFKGKASLISGQSGATTGSQMVYCDQAKRINPAGAVTDIEVKKEIFVHRIDSRAAFVWRGTDLNLADVVGGGNGFGTGVIDKGIDVRSGEWCEKLGSIKSFNGPHRYVPVWESEFIDGIFVADNRTGDIVINSAGDVVKLDYLTDGGYWGYIFNGAFHHGPNGVYHHALILDGQKYGTADNPAITMHSNLGITFDMDKLRSTIPFLNIKKFVSRAGVSETVERFGGQSCLYLPCEFHVLIDGRKAFSKNTTASEGSFSIDVPIQKQDRFLTLIVTDGGNGIGFDWGLFVNPTLVVECEEDTKQNR